MSSLRQTAIFDEQELLKQSKPSLHVFGTVQTANMSKLTSMSECIDIIKSIVERVGAQCLGTFEHQFDETGGFTAVVCLAESHVAIHTWPELSSVTLDVYLCNFINDNTDKCQAIFDHTVQHFEPETVEVKKLLRS